MIQNALFLLVLLVISACNSGGGGSSGGGSEPIPTGPTYNVSGSATFDFVPITSSGLDYENTIQKPVRNVIIQARRPSDNAVVATTNTDDNGDFTIAIPQALTTYYIAILAKMSSPNITIEDNTASNAVYLAQDSVKTNSGDVTLANINLPSGWSGTNAAGGYNGTRYSAPFAILDTIYTAHKKILDSRPSFTLPALKVNWSVNNYPSGVYTPSTGAIVTSHFDGSELYILGKAETDSDEHDHHVIVHEWGHFVEDKISRSDSLGGQHSSGDKLNMSLAFGEGFGNALSAIILDPETTYRDSMGDNQQTIAVSMNIESGADLNKGWFSETSVQQLLFDVYDGANEAFDTVSLGVGPIIDVLSGSQKTTPGFTSIFSFISYLKAQNAGSANAINNLTANKNISNVADIYGTGETNDGGDPDTLPIYNVLANNVAVSLDLGGSNFRMNEMRNNRYFTWTATSSVSRFTLTCSDLCIIGVFRAGVLLADTETFSTTILNVSTTIGQEYSILLTTDDERTNGTANITTSLKAQAL